MDKESNRSKRPLFVIPLIIAVMAYGLGILSVTNFLILRNLQKLNFQLVVTLKDGLTLTELVDEQQDRMLEEENDAMMMEKEETTDEL